MGGARGAGPLELPPHSSSDELLSSKCRTCFLGGFGSWLAFARFRGFRFWGAPRRFFRPPPPGIVACVVLWRPLADLDSDPNEQKAKALARNLSSDDGSCPSGHLCGSGGGMGEPREDGVLPPPACDIAARGDPPTGKENALPPDDSKDPLGIARGPLPLPQSKGQGSEPRAAFTTHRDSLSPSPGVLGASTTPLRGADSSRPRPAAKRPLHSPLEDICGGDDDSSSSSIEDGWTMLERMRKKSKTRSGLRKRARNDSGAPSREEAPHEEHRRCSICYDTWNASGRHRICSLKCGHLFGKSCAEKWVREHKNCPQCKARARPSDIRLLFATHIVAHDISIVTELRGRLDQEAQRRRRAETELGLVMRKHRILRDSFEQLRFELQRVQAMTGSASSGTGQGATNATPRKPVPPQQPLSSNGHPTSPLSVPARTSSSVQSPGTILNRFQYRAAGETRVPPTPMATQAPTTEATDTVRVVKAAEIPCVGARVVGFEPSTHDMLISSTWPPRPRPRAGGYPCAPPATELPHGVYRVSATDSSHWDFIGLHSKPIRDLAPAAPGRCGAGAVVLTAGMDGRIVVSSLETRSALIESRVGSMPVWSCAWDARDTHLFYGGLSAGRVACFDARRTDGPVTTLACPTKKPVHSLVSTDKGIIAATTSDIFLLPRSPATTGPAAATWTSLLDGRKLLGRLGHDAVTDALIVPCRGRAAVADAVGTPNNERICQALYFQGQTSGATAPPFTKTHAFTGHSNRVVMPRAAAFTLCLPDAKTGGAKPTVESLHGSSQSYAAAIDEPSGTVWLWNVRTEQRVAVLGKHTSAVCDVAFAARKGGAGGVLATLSVGKCITYDVGFSS